jgi:hypothetical protein
MQVGEVKAAGNSNTTLHYEFSDDTPSRGINYYRLRIIDFDNSVKYSAVRSVRNEGEMHVSVYPNPARAAINVQVNIENMDKGVLEVRDITGKTVVAKALQLSGGNNLIPVQLTGLPAGPYIIKLTLKDQVITRKFDKQ